MRVKRRYGTRSESKKSDYDAKDSSLFSMKEDACNTSHICNRVKSETENISKEEPTSNTRVKKRSRNNVDVLDKNHEKENGTKKKKKLEHPVCAEINTVKNVFLFTDLPTDVQRKIVSEHSSVSDRLRMRTFVIPRSEIWVRDIEDVECDKKIALALYAFKKLGVAYKTLAPTLIHACISRLDRYNIPFTCMDSTLEEVIELFPDIPEDIRVTRKKTALATAAKGWIKSIDSRSSHEDAKNLFDLWGWSSEESDMSDVIKNTISQMARMTPKFFDVCADELDRRSIDELWKQQVKNQVSSKLLFSILNMDNEMLLVHLRTFPRKADSVLNESAIFDEMLIRGTAGCSVIWFMCCNRVFELLLVHCVTDMDISVLRAMLDYMFHLDYASPKIARMVNIMNSFLNSN